jgi:hypothetical protein
MANLMTGPPPQLSQDGHWRWDGHQWEPAQPSSPEHRKRSGPVSAQLSPDGQWWWTGREWVPAEALKPDRRGDRAATALGLGFLPLGAAFAMSLGTQAGVEGWSKFSPAAIIIILAVCAAPALIVGTLVLARPAPSPGLRRRRIMASIGIALALLGSIALFALMLTINSFIGP